MLYSLIYISSATRDFTFKDLDDMLLQSREKNKSLGITGLLILKDHTFLQYIEGEKSQVKKLFETISKDKRHDNIMVIKEEDTNNRIFQDWNMGFKDIRRVPKSEHEFLINFNFEDHSKLPDIFQFFINKN